jgi:uncharacterized membrane protein
MLGIASLTFQGVGAFITKLVVTPAGPSALLLMSALVQVAVGLFLASPQPLASDNDLWRFPALFTVVAYVTASIATIGYLVALASGPASVVVPLVATSPALAGLVAIVFLHERTSDGS